MQLTRLVAASPEEVFEFFADAFNLEALTPPLLAFEVATPGPISMATGTRIAYRLRLHGLRLGWLTEIRDWAPPHRFVDTQVRGPYGHWHHTHEFEALPGGGTLMRDTGLMGTRANAAGFRYFKVFA